MKLAGEADSYIFTAKKPIDIPGYGKVPGPTEKDAIVTYGDNLIKAKNEAQVQMHNEADAIAAKAAERNHEGRVKIIKGVKGAADRYIPMLAAGPKVDDMRDEDHFLPVISGGDTWDFKEHYKRQFTEWTAKLGYPNNLRPVADEIKDRKDEATKAKTAAAQASGIPAVVGSGESAGSVQLTAEESAAIVKGVISNCAAAIRCYVDEGAFQKRSFLTSSSPPTRDADFRSPDG